jgi:hypothetical protein
VQQRYIRNASTPLQKFKNLQSVLMLGAAFIWFQCIKSEMIHLSNYDSQQEQVIIEKSLVCMNPARTTINTHQINLCETLLTCDILYIHLPFAWILFIYGIHMLCYVHPATHPSISNTKKNYTYSWFCKLTAVTLI